MDNAFPNTLFKKFKLDNFKFSNQSFSKIGMEMFYCLNGITELKKSSYNNEVLEIVDNYFPRALYEKLGDVKQEYRFNYGWDYTASYSLAMYSFGGKKLPIISLFDNFVLGNILPIDFFGFVLIDATFFRGVKIDTGIYPNFFIEKLIDLGIQFNVRGFVECKEYINGNLFKNFVESSYKLLDNPKMVLNPFTGMLNKKYKTSNNSFITKCPEIRDYAIREGYNIEFTEFKDDFEGEQEQIYICSGKDKQRLNEDNSMLYNSIISMGIINCLEIIKQVPEDVIITGINTDCCYFVSKTEIKEPMVDKSNLLSILKQPIRSVKYQGIGKEIVKKRKAFVPKEKKNWTIGDLDSSCATFGSAGSSKSYTTSEYLISKGESIIGCSYMNSAVQVLREYGIEKSMTIHNLLGIGIENESNTKATDLKDISCIIVDEFFTIPKDLMVSFVNYLKKFPLLKVYILGDIKQNGYISSGFHYDYTK